MVTPAKPIDRAEVLQDLDLLSRLLSAFPLLHEPASEPIAVVNIKYSANFKFVMGLYNSLNEMSRAQQLPADACPSWLLVLAYAIGCCPAHYSAWQQRREVVMDAERFAACAFSAITSTLSSSSSVPPQPQQQCGFFMTPEAANEENVDAMLLAMDDDGTPKEPYRTDWRRHFESRRRAGQSECPPSGGEGTDAPQQVTVVPAASLSTFDRRRLAVLLPSPEADFGPITSSAAVACSSSSSGNDGGAAATAEADDASDAVLGASPSPLIAAYSPWHAARWELRQSAAIARKSHKNFQIWHHRKELIAFAMRASADDNNTFTSEDSVLFADSAAAASPVAFADIDDRVLCDAVLLQQDSKNYHVWQHRAWFISAFNFLHRVDLRDLHASCLLDSAAAVDAALDPSFFKLTPSSLFGGGDVLSLYHATLDNCRRMPRGMHFFSSSASAPSSSPLQKEIDYASILVTEDVFNNSAWSYRMHLVEQYVLPAFAEAERNEEKEGEKDDESANEGLAHGSAWARRFVALVLEELSYALTQACREVCNECPFVYAKGICDLYARVVTASFAKHNNCKNSSSDSGANNACSKGPFAIIFGAEELHPALVATLMHRSFMSAAASDAMPIVRQVRTEVCDGRTPYGKRSTFIKLNTHQCEAALFHAGAAVAGTLWGALAARAVDSPQEPMIAAVEGADEGDDSTVQDGAWLMAMAGLSDEKLADHGFFTRNKSAPLFLKVAGEHRRLVAPVSGCVHASAEALHSLAASMVAHERQCLALAKKLFVIDEIRAKYWRFELKRLAFREE